MVDPKIVEYFKTNMAAGYSAEQIKQKVVESGVSESDANEAIAVAQSSQIPMKPAPKGINKWVIIVPLIVLILVWAIFGVILLRG